MTKQKTIYDLGLHDSLSDNGIIIWRVPGGWIYNTSYYGGSSDVFVPYSDEFLPERECKHQYNGDNRTMVRVCLKCGDSIIKNKAHYKEHAETCPHRYTVDTDKCGLECKDCGSSWINNNK